MFHHFYSMPLYPSLSHTLEPVLSFLFSHIPELTALLKCSLHKCKDGHVFNLKKVKLNNVLLGIFTHVGKLQRRVKVDEQILEMGYFLQSRKKRQKKRATER